MTDPSSSGEGLFLSAVAESDLNRINLLIFEKEDINIKDKDGCTPLMYALHQRAYSLALQLIENGADLKDYNRVSLIYNPVEISK
jgi:ankyrin repeat protein